MLDWCGQATKYWVTCGNKKLCDAHEELEYSNCITKDYINPSQVLEIINDYALLVNQIVIESHSLDIGGLNRSNLLWYVKEAEQIMREAEETMNIYTSESYFPLFDKAERLTNDFLNSKVYKKCSSLIILHRAKDPTIRNTIDLKLTYSKIDYTQEIEKVTRDIDSKIIDTLTSYHSELAWQLSDLVKKIYQSLKEKYEKVVSKLEYQTQRLNSIISLILNPILIKELNELATSFMNYKGLRWAGEFEKKMMPYQKICSQIAEIITHDPSLIQSQNISTQTIIRSFTHSYEELNEKYPLHICMNGQTHLNMVSLLKKTRLPPLEELWIWKIPIKNSEGKDLKEFITHSFPSKLALFAFNYNGELLDGGYYLTSEVLANFKKVTKEVYITNCKLSTRLFCDIIKHSSGCQTVWITKCLITDPEKQINFNIHSTYKVEVLDLDSTGDEDHCDWRSNYQHLSRLFEAIVQSGLKQSLKTIDVSQCGLKEHELQVLIDRAQLEKIDISIDYGNTKLRSKLLKI